MLKLCGRFFLLMVAGVVLAACALLAPDLVDSGFVRFEIQESRPVSITHATAFRDGASTVIRGGAAYPPYVWYGHFTGHVDLEILFPDGRAERYLVQVRPTRLPKVRGRRAFFVKRIQSELPKGTVIRAAYEEG